MSTLQLIASQVIVRTCANPGCDNPVRDDRSRGGRPRRYCGETCKRSNASKMRTARRRVEQQRAAVAEQSIQVGMGDVPPAAVAREATSSLTNAVASLDKAVSLLSKHTHEWTQAPRRLSPDGRSPEELLVLISREVRDVISFLRALERVVGRAEINRIATRVDRISSASADLAQMLDVSVPPNVDITVRYTAEEIATWYDYDLPRP